MIITAGMLDISHEIRELYEFHIVIFFMLYYVTDHAGFMSEHQFVAFMHVLNVLFRIGITTSMLLVKMMT